MYKKSGFRCVFLLVKIFLNKEIPAGQVWFSTIFKRRPKDGVKIPSFFDRKRYLYSAIKLE